MEALYCVLEALRLSSQGTCRHMQESMFSVLAGHPAVEVPGIEFNSGALGHGLSIRVGCAIAAKMDKSLIALLFLWATVSRVKAQYMRLPWRKQLQELDNLVHP